MKSVSFRFTSESKVVDFLRWHNQTKKKCFVRYYWNGMQKPAFDIINIVFIHVNISELLIYVYCLYIYCKND